MVKNYSSGSVSDKKSEKCNKMGWFPYIENRLFRDVEACFVHEKHVSDAHSCQKHKFLVIFVHVREFSKILCATRDTPPALTLENSKEATIKT